MTKKLWAKVYAVSVLLCATLLNPLSAYAAVYCDTSVMEKHHVPIESGTDDRNFFKPKHIILPASLIAVGTFGVYNGGFKQLNRSIKNGMDKMRGSCYFHIDDYIQYLPVVSYLGLDFVGVKAKHTFKERLVVGATAYIAMASIVNITKYTLKEPRPDTGTKNSFPSGHTATVFTGAELIREEYGTGVGIGAYSVAVGVAFLRLYNCRHWFNDVIAGVGIGILSARVGYWMLPIYRKWFKWDNAQANSAMIVVPTYHYGEHCFSINLAYTF